MNEELQKAREDYRKLLVTTEQAGIPYLTDEFCAKLLGYVYAYGGANEQVVFNVQMNEDIKHAQSRFGITGGSRPNARLLPLLQKYLRQVEPLMKEMSDKHFTHPAWAQEVVDRYKMPKMYHLDLTVKPMRPVAPAKAPYVFPYYLL